MRLKGLFLLPDLVDYRTDPAASFRWQTRFVCHYVQRFVTARKVQADGFNRICVICKEVVHVPIFINSSNALTVQVPFDMAVYESTSVADLPEYFIGLLEAGLSIACENQNLPFDVYKEAIDSFRALGYKNRWVHKEKAFRAAGLKCRLLCELDLSWFHLVLEVERAGEVVLSHEILRTLPDEVIFAHRFKDIELDGTTLRVTAPLGDPLAEFDVGSKFVC